MSLKVARIKIICDDIYHLSFKKVKKKKKRKKERKKERKRNIDIHRNLTKFCTNLMNKIISVKFTKLSQRFATQGGQKDLFSFFSTLFLLKHL